ncbi:MAG TPA: hypothetical protein VI251_04635 [Pseudolabrys sp.]
MDREAFLLLYGLLIVGLGRRQILWSSVARTHLSLEKDASVSRAVDRPGTFFIAQSWAGCITNMPEFNLRQAQALAVLRELHAITGAGRFLIPHHRRGTAQPMPPDTLNNAIRSLGFAKEARCAHGTRATRATAKTLLGAERQENG